MEIIWTDEALEDLHVFTQYYYQVAGIRVARKMRKIITDAVEILSAFPFIGAQIPNRAKVYRAWVVHPYYKVVYRIAEKEISILLIWDCRRNPADYYERIRLG